MSSSTVAWNAVPGAAGYAIYRGTSSHGEASTPIGTSTTTEYTDSEVLSGNKYYYCVKAQYPGSVSSASPEASVTVGSTRIASEPTVAQPSPIGNKVYWKRNPNAAFYLIQRFDPDLGWAVINRANSGAITSFVDAGVVSGVTYRYRIISANGDGAGDPGGEFSVTAGDAPAAAPSGIMARTYSGAIQVTWNPVPGATGYVVYRSAGPGLEGASPYWIASTWPYFSEAVDNGAAAFYKVAAIDASGVGIQSAEATAIAGSSVLLAPSVAGTTASGLIRISWTPVEGATGYIVLRSVGDQFGYSIYARSSSVASSFVDTAVAPGARYYYEVCGYWAGGAGSTGATNLVAGSTYNGVSTGISVLPATSYLDVRWAPVAGATYYNLYRGKYSGGEGLWIPGVVGTEQYDTSVDPSTLYYYKVKPVMNGIEGGFSGEASGIASSALLPGPSTYAKTSGGKIHLYIGKVAGAATYNVYRRAVSDYQFVMLKSGAVIPSGSTYAEFVDSTAIPYVNYAYTATAVRVSGEGAFSPVTYATAGNPAIQAPTGTIAFANSYQINLGWDSVAGALSYNVYRSTSPTMPAIPFYVGVSQGFTDATAASGTVYYYAVAAVDYNGQSTLSPVCSGKLGYNTLNSPVLTLNQGAASLDLAWSPVSGVLGYDLYRAEGSGSYRMLAQKIAATSYIDDDATPGTQYTYKVFPVALIGAGNVSNRVTGIAGSLRIAAPSGLAAIPGATSVQLRFNPVQGALTYNIYRGAVAGGEGAVPIGVDSFPTTFTDSPLQSGVRYFYKVTAVDAHGQSLKSEEVSARVGATRLAQPTATVSAQGASLKLQWTPVSGATSYDVYRSIYGGVSYLYRRVSSTNLVDDAVLSGADYSYAVAGVNADGEGNKSASVTAHT